MLFSVGKKQYESVVGSDLEKDGMFLELSDAENNLVLYAFWSDANDGFTFSAYEQELPFSLVEWFVQEARKRLPPMSVVEEQNFDEQT